VSRVPAKDRAPTPFELSSRYVDELATLSPTLATSLGIPGYDHLWGRSFGLDGHEERMQLVRRTRAELSAHAEHDDPDQRIAARVLIGSLDEEIASDEAGEHLRDLSHMASSFQNIRWTFDVMKDDDDGHWSDICQRLETIHEPYDQLRERLRVGRERGHHVARRQVASVAQQARRLASDGSAFDQLAARGAGRAAASGRLSKAIDHAKAVLARFADHLEADVLPTAPTSDGIGIELYCPALDRLVGKRIDPREAYAWGWEEFHRLLGEMRRVGDRILPGGSFEAVKELLETDPERAAHSREAFVAFIDERLTRAREALAGEHFDVDPRLEALSVDFAPDGSPLGAYYVAPSEDFSRPGGIRYSVGDQTVFPLYHQVSTAYHEGFPGHHLQVGTAMVRAERISRAHRLLIWYPGYGEGWAMYTERLMGELGFLERPEWEFGMLAKQLYRAARVVVDIGLHLGLDVDTSSPLFAGEPWTFERAAEVMRVYGFRTPAQSEAEVMRYLGWPAQAVTYKLGEREILALREETRSRLGARFSLKELHDHLIGHGPLRFELLRDSLAEWLPD
jgi:uncharacterized protein (DUF885 family)